MPDISETLTSLPTTTRDVLEAAWEDHYGTRPPPRLSRATLALGVAYALQAAVYGDLSARHTRHLKQLIAKRADGPAVSVPPPFSLRPGVRLMREWNGETQLVDVLDDGFAWKGERYGSLSAVARAITGTRWSGPRFFGLNQAFAAREKRQSDTP